MTEAEALKTQMAVLAANMSHLTKAIENLEEKIVTRLEHSAVEQRVEKLESSTTWASRGILAALLGVAANAVGLHWK